MAPVAHLAESIVSADEVNGFARRDFPGNASVCEEVGPGWARVSLRVGRDQLRPGSIIAGPTIFGICDVALYYACFTAIGIEPMTVTSGLSIHFLRPATGPLLHARADLSSVGRRNLCGNIVAWTDAPSAPVAVAQGVYVRPPSKTAAKR